MVVCAVGVGQTPFPLLGARMRGCALEEASVVVMFLAHLPSDCAFAVLAKYFAD